MTRALAIRAGTLRHLVTIIRHSYSTDAHGTLQPSPSPSAPTWAEIRQLAGRELYEARQVIESVTHEITLRTPATAIEEDDRIQHTSGGRTWNYYINAVIDVDQRLHKTVVLCTRERVTG